MLLALSTAFLQRLRHQRQTPQADSCSAKDRSSHGRSQTHERGLACTHRRLVFAVDQLHFNLRRVAEAGQAVCAEMRVANAAGFEEYGHKHGTTDALDDRTGDLIT